MKRLISALFALTIMLCMGASAFAYTGGVNYDFSTGTDVTFGKPTSTDEPVSSDPLSENTRRNKDAAYLPPPYGVFSGNIPTDPSSLYHDLIRLSRR